ncbi:MAG: hypothetical protein GWP16_05360 [Nitrospirae bacterium]|nr:hypothetical protein [Nitrospirota bacterium]
MIESTKLGSHRGRMGYVFAYFLQAYRSDLGSGRLILSARPISTSIDHLDAGPADRYAEVNPVEVGCEALLVLDWADGDQGRPEPGEELFDRRFREKAQIPEEMELLGAVVQEIGDWERLSLARGPGGHATSGLFWRAFEQDLGRRDEKQRRNFIRQILLQLFQGLLQLRIARCRQIHESKLQP